MGVKVEKMEKELSKLTENAMSYKSIYAKSARQMAMEAMQACDMEAASCKKVRKTVVSSPRGWQLLDRLKTDVLCVLYCTVQYCTVQYNTVLYSTLLYCIVHSFTVQYYHLQIAQ